MPIADALALLNEMAAELGITGSAQPRTAYWKLKHGRKMFGYNIEPVAAMPQHDGKQWAAVIYRTTKNGSKLVKERYFRKRKSARACAYRWYKTAQRRYEKKAAVVKHEQV